MKRTVLYYSILVLVIAAVSANGQDERTFSREATSKLVEAVRYEMQTKSLPAVAIVLSDSRGTVWNKAFGYADPSAKKELRPTTVFRVGSVSKLFTAISVMQLVEKRELKLEEPIETYLPNFRVKNPFATPMTLRHLLTHHGGIVREPPVGNYFDTDAPSIARTVRSLNSTTLVYEPGTKFKYSNAGMTVAGYVVEQRKRKPFVLYVHENILRPAGMKNSSFGFSPYARANIASASMWTYHKADWKAPALYLGISPAANLYTTPEDIGTFITLLLNRGTMNGKRIIGKEALESMWEPQFAQKNARSGWGIGFELSRLDGKRVVGHAGAVYGFATNLSVLPDDDIGVAVFTTVESTNIVCDRLAEYALRLVLASRAGKPLPNYVRTTPVPAPLASSLVGYWGAHGEIFSITDYKETVYIDRGTYRNTLRMLGDSLIADDRLSFGPTYWYSNDTLRTGNVFYTRVLDSKPLRAPERFRELIGEYGWGHNTLYIYEHRGMLFALIEWFDRYPLKEIGKDEYAFPPYGMYHGERIRFRRNDNRLITGALVAGINFPRRSEEGGSVRIKPLRPVHELRLRALRAAPPKEQGRFVKPSLTELRSLDSSFVYDIRYATDNNFMGTSFYTQSRAFLQRPAADALVQAHRELRRKGYSVLIHDAYRPWYVTKTFWDATPRDKKDFVADPAKGSRHNRGCAVDCSLIDLTTGTPAEMVSAYDEFSDRAHPLYPGGTSLARWHRRLLRETLERHGFSVFDLEWWHFDYTTWRQYPILNLPFEDIR